MRTVRNYPVCNGCIHSSLNHCDKFNKQCVSVIFDTDRYQLACLDCLNNDSYEFGVKDIKKSEKLAYFHLPGPENLETFKPFFTMRKFYPEAFYENRVVSEIYGSFAGAIWNGRTPNYGDISLTIQQIDNIRREIEDLGISLNLTWNNHLVSGTDVHDRFCNAITEVFHNGKHSITVASQELFEYLYNKYPNFTYYSSVISTTCDPDFVIKDERFDYYLMNRHLNNNWDALLKIPEEQRGNIEFLCNDACTPICQRMHHYNVVNSCLLNRSNEDCLGNYCTIDHDFIRFNAKLWPITINPEDIDKYVENGFQHFKLCSRGDISPIIALKMCQYLVKPEFVEDVFGWCMIGARTSEEFGKNLEKNSLIKEV